MCVCVCRGEVEVEVGAHQKAVQAPEFYEAFWEPCWDTPFIFFCPSGQRLQNTSKFKKFSSSSLHRYPEPFFFCSLQDGYNFCVTLFSFNNKTTQETHKHWLAGQPFPYPTQPTLRHCAPILSNITGIRPKILSMCIDAPLMWDPLPLADNSPAERQTLTPS